MFSRRSCPGLCLLLFLGVALTSSSCGLIAFDATADIPSQTIPGSPLGALLPASLFAIPVNIDLQSQTAAQGTGPARSVTLKSLSLTITSPAGASFGFVTSISISIAGPDGSSLPQREIARLEPVPAEGTIALEPVPGVDLLPYIKAGANITATASGHAPSSDVTFDGKIVVTIHV